MVGEGKACVKAELPRDEVGISSFARIKK